MRLALAFSVSFRTRPFEEVPKVIDESSNSSCLCSSSESSSMYHADRRPWLRVRIDPPDPSPASSLGDSLRLDRCGAVCVGGVISSLALLLLLLSGEGSGDSAGGGVDSSVLITRGRPRRLGAEVVPESDSTDVSCVEDVPPSSPVDWSSSSSGVELLRLPLLVISSISCLVFLPLFLPGGRPRGLEGLAGVITSAGLPGGSILDFRPLLPMPRVTWLLWPFRWTVLWDEGLTGEPRRTLQTGHMKYFNQKSNYYWVTYCLWHCLSYQACVALESWVFVECFLQCCFLQLERVSLFRELPASKLSQSYEPSVNE